MVARARAAEQGRRLRRLTARAKLRERGCESRARRPSYKLSARRHAVAVTALEIGLVAMALANLWAFGLCAFDKRAARLGRRRVPELRLLAPVVVGGPLGLLAGMQLFRHKTVKRSFQLKLAVATLVFLAWTAALIWALFRT
jgi:uncharacterized membrane protein YsdA (DUF1294 family)